MKLTLRVTKCHREVIFNGAYIMAHARYQCNVKFYRIFLSIPIITSFFLEIQFHFDFAALTWVMLKLVVLKITKLSIGESL